MIKQALLISILAAPYRRSTPAMNRSISPDTLPSGTCHSRPVMVDTTC